MIRILNRQDCCGCAACVQRCPKNCITLKEDEEGFLYPNVDIDACIDCHLCEKVCPLIHNIDKIHPKEILAVKNRNEDERMASSSGGVFIALAATVKLEVQLLHLQPPSLERSGKGGGWRW